MLLAIIQCTWILKHIRTTKEGKKITESVIHKVPWELKRKISAGNYTFEKLLHLAK